MAEYTQVINPGSGYTLKLAVTESDISTANNTSKVTVTGVVSRNGDTYKSRNANGSANTVNINGTTYNPNTAFDLYNNWSVQIFSYTQTITHNADGSKSIPISWSFNGQSGTYAANGSISITRTLTKIARGATVTSVADFNDEQNPVVKYSNPAGSAATSLQACISFDGSNEHISYRDISKTGTSYTFNLTSDERNALRQQAQAKNKIDLWFFVKTVVGGTTFYSNKKAVMSIVNANPVFETEYSDTNSTITGITTNNQIIVQNQSNLQIKVRLAEAYKNAYLVKATCTILGTTHTVNFPSNTFHGGTVTFNIGKVNTAQNIQPKIVVTDSRGNTNASNPTITVAAWKTPSAVIAMQRENSYYANTSIKCDAGYSSVNSKNTISIQMRYKKQGTSTWSSYTTLSDNVAKNFTLDNNYAWDVQFLLTDKFSSVTINAVLARGQPIIFFDKNKSSVGINKFPSGDKTLEVAGNIETTADLVANNADLDGNLHVGVNAIVDRKITAGSDGIYAKDGKKYFNSNFNVVYSDSTASNYWHVSGPSKKNALKVYVNTGEVYVNGSQGITEHVLYDNANGTNANFTLSETAANFRRIKIFFRTNGSCYGSTEAEAPNGKNISLIGFWGSDTGAALDLKCVVAKVSGTSVSLVRPTQASMRDAQSLIVAAASSIYVTKVVGYK